MRIVSYTNRFKRDYRREKTGRHGKATPKINDVGRRVGKLLRNPPFAARGRRCVGKGGGSRKSLPTLRSPGPKPGRAGMMAVADSVISKKVDARLMEVVNFLAADTPLPRRNFDHALTGEWSDHCDCHVRPDLVLIYRKPDGGNLQRVRLGSHSELDL